jgi:uncharacterized membrane protein SirB2
LNNAASFWMQWYWPLKQAHVALVGLSVGFFAARGAAVLARRAWPLAPWARWGSVGVDTLLLTAGVSLWALLGLNPLVDAWLGGKLLLLVAYIVLGSLALKRARTPWGKAACYALALAAAGTMVSVALTRRPLGWVSWISSIDTLFAG